MITTNNQELIYQNYMRNKLGLLIGGPRTKRRTEEAHAKLKRINKMKKRDRKRMSHRKKSG